MFTIVFLIFVDATLDADEKQVNIINVAGNVLYHRN